MDRLSNKEEEEGLQVIYKKTCLTNYVEQGKGLRTNTVRTVRYSSHGHLRL